MSLFPSTEPTGLQQPLLSAPALHGQGASSSCSGGAKEQRSPLGAPVLLGQDAGGSGGAKAAEEAGGSGGAKEAGLAGAEGLEGAGLEEAGRGGTAGQQPSGVGGQTQPSLWQRIFETAQDVFSPFGLVVRERDASINRAPRGGEQPSVQRKKHEDDALKAMPSAPLINVMAAMSKYDGNDFAEAGCQRLCELQAQQEEGLLAAGAMELVLRAMERHKGARSLPVQEAGVRFLRDAASTREGQAKVAAAGGCQAVLRAMSGRAALGSPSMQELGCGAVLNLARDHAEGRSKGHAAWKLGMKGGVEAVLEAMKAGEEHAQVQERACAALRALMLDQGNQVKVLENDGIQAMLHAATTHTADAAVVREACLALLLLAKDFADSLPKMAAAGARDAVARCAAGHGADAAVQAASRPLLSVLESAKEGQARLPRQPALEEETMEI